MALARCDRQNSVGGVRKSRLGRAMEADWDRVLPVGLARREGTPPPVPVTFDEGYVLPPHSDKPLQALHPHPHDAHISFHEKPHIYTWNWG